MVFSEIRHGVGNQMMQYAFARKIAEERGEDVYVVKRWYREENWKRNGKTKRKYQLGNFEISAKRATKRQEKKFWINRDSIVSKAKTYVSKKLQINPGGNVFFGRCMYENPERNINEISKCKGSVYLVGLWKHINYFGDIIDKIRDDFELKNDIGEENKKMIRKIRQHNSVSMHVRRGDYLEREQKVLSDTKYYKKSLQKIIEREKDIKIYVFSDDIEWCKENFKFKLPAEFVDTNENREHYKDIILMKSCQHNIVANSTFSLWGAMLNNNNEKIVTGPKQWVDKIGGQYIDEIIGTEIN